MYIVCTRTHNTLLPFVDVLSEMPRTSLPCEDCGELLRIWPSNMGPSWFKCCDPDCWSKGALINNNGAYHFFFFLSYFQAHHWTYVTEFWPWSLTSPFTILLIKIWSRIYWLNYTFIVFPLSGTNRFNCFTCDRDTCRECGNAEMADAKNVKDDPLVLAKSIMKHRGSRDSAKVNIFFSIYKQGPSIN